jgi:hypothetical protein
VQGRLKALILCLNISPTITIYTLGDGAKWVKDVLDSLHPKTQFLLDYYHAASYVSNVGSLKYFTRKKLGKSKSRKYRRKLKTHGGSAIVKDLKLLRFEIGNSSMAKKDKESDRDIIDHILGYIEGRITQMNYQKARKEQRPIGSGFIESACKLIVKQRLGLSGGRFYLEAAERIMQLRCIIMMDAWEILVDQMYQKQFQIRHCKPSSSYEPVIYHAA